MSYSFLVPTAHAPPVADLLRRISGDDLMVVHEDLLAKWPETTITLCRRARSTRGIYLSYAAGEIEIKTNVSSADEDYALALQLVAAAAEATGSLPRGDYTTPMPVEELRAAHGPTWIKESHASALRATRTLVKERGTMGLGGPFRVCYVGPRMLERVSQGGDDAAIAGILDLMRTVQWLHAAGYETASDFTIGGTEEHLAIWFPTKRMFLPSVQWITLGDVEPLPIFPFERLPDVLGRPLTLVDECQPLIEPTPSKELPALVARARQYHTSPTKAAPKPAPAPAASGPVVPATPPNTPPKPWWKIW